MKTGKTTNRCIKVCIATFLAMFTFSKCYICSAFQTPSTIEECESKISENNTEIELCERIKTNLHTTAEAMRQQSNYDAEFVGGLSAEWIEQNDYQQNLLDENKDLYSVLEALRLAKQKFVGNFKITYYCTENYHHICNNGNAFTTATGTVPTPGRTIAVDPKKIPYGTKVVIDGHTYIAEDCGGAIKGNKIDICVTTHSEALQKGVRYNVPVYILEE